MTEETTRYIYLNYPLSGDTPRPPAIPAIRLTSFMSLAKGDDANVTTIEVKSHTGTHVDAPYHVTENGLRISDFMAGELIFQRPLVVDLPLQDCEVVQPHHLEGFVGPASQTDLLLFRFGYGSVRRSQPERFSTQCPGFGVESAHFIRANFPSVRAIGMDVPSLSCIATLDETMAAHNVLLEGMERRFLIIEDMDLERDLTHLTQVVVAPWMIVGLDGSPATIIGRLDE